MSPELGAALAGVLVAWIEFRGGKSKSHLETRVSLLEHRMDLVEKSK